MTRLYDIYRNDNEKFKIEKDKNLEMVYLLKSFTYYPIPFFIHDSNIRFPLNTIGSILKFLENNFFIVEDICQKILPYIDELMTIEEYRKIMSQRDIIFIKGTIESFLWSYDIEGGKTSYDTLIALTYDNFHEATFKLVTIYLNNLKRIKEKEKENKDINKREVEELTSKISDLFEILEKNKYYPAYAEYGYFLYNDIGMFDKALEIFKEGYEPKQYNCALYYFQAFTKSENQKIYDNENFKSNKFIDILQALIDSFIIGESNSLHDIFDYIHISYLL